MELSPRDFFFSQIEEQVKTIPGIELREKLSGQHFPEFVVRVILDKISGYFCSSDRDWVKKAILLLPERLSQHPLVRKIKDYSHKEICNRWAIYNSWFRGPVTHMLELGDIEMAEQFLKEGKGNFSVLKHLLQKKDMPLLQRFFPYLRSFVNEGRYPPLFIAMSAGFLEGAQFLIENGADTAVVTKDGSTALHMAVGHEYRELAFTLIEEEMNLDDQNDRGETPLHLALEKGLDDVALAIIKKGRGLEKCDHYGFQPLHRALWEGRKEAAMALLDQKPPVNARANGNWIPLQIAFLEGFAQVAKRLLEKGADPRLEGKGGGIALHWVADVELCRELLDRGLDIETRDSCGYTPLLKALENKRHEVANLFLNRGARVDVKARDGNTALHFVTDVALARRLVEGGIKPTASHLDEAVENRRWDIAAFFVEQGVTSSDSALVSSAVEAMQWDLVGQLLDAGFDPNRESERLYESPLRLTISYDAPIEIIGKFIRAGAKTDKSISKAILCLRWDIAEFLIDQGVDVGKDKESLFSAVGKNASIEFIRKLVQSGANINVIDSSNRKCLTPLQHALEEKKWDIAEFFLDEGADPNLGESSTLYVALQNDAPDELIGKLVYKGAVLKQDDYSNPLHLAFRKGRFTISNLFFHNFTIVDNGTVIEAIHHNAPLEQIKILCDESELSTEGALKKAVQYERWEIAGFLLRRTRRIENNVFYFAITNKAPLLLIKNLWCSGIDFNGQFFTYRDFTSLQFALENQYWEAALWFIEQGADVNRTKRREDHPLYLAIKEGAPASLIDALRKKGAIVPLLEKKTRQIQTTPLCDVIERKDWLEAVRIINDGDDVNRMNSYRQSPLMLAVDHGAPLIFIEMLRNRGAVLKPSLDIHLEKRSYARGSYPIFRAKEISASISIYDAVSQGDSERVKAIVDKEGFDINAKGEKECTPLMHAVAERRRDIAAFLIGKGADVNLPSGFLEKLPLEEAIENGDIVMATLLLDHGAQPNLGSRRGGLLGAASREGDFDMIKLLVARGAVVDESVVHSALNRYRRDITLYLIGKAENVSGTDRYGDTVLHDVHDSSLIDPLLEKGAEIDATNQNGKTALHYHIQKNNMDRALHLLKKGARCDIPDLAGNLPLHCVKSKELCRALLDADSSCVNQKNKSGEFPLWIAAKEGRLGIVSLLIESGADTKVIINTKSLLHFNIDPTLVPEIIKGGLDVNNGIFPGVIPLHEAVSCDRIGLARALLNHGADITIRHPSKGTPFHEVRSVAMAELFLSKKPDEQLITEVCQEAIKNNVVEVVIYLHQHGADISRGSPLHTVRSAKMIAYLVSQGVDVNGKYEYKHPPLHYAAEDGKVHLARELLKQGATLLPLHHAKGEAMSELFLEHGADIEQVVDGETPIEHAVNVKEDRDQARYLLKQGATITTKIADKLREYGDSKTLQILRDRGLEPPEKKKPPRSYPLYARRGAKYRRSTKRYYGKGYKV